METTPPVLVHLEDHEVMVAIHVGTMRQSRSVLRKDRQAANGTPRDGWGAHIEGAGGEMAAAKALGVYWPCSVDTFKRGGDLAAHIEVRSRIDEIDERGFATDLCVNDNDDPARCYVMVTGKLPDFKIWGWLYGYEARSCASKDTKHRGRQFYIPRHKLHPLAELPMEGLDA
jgi:hypothetical protein